MTASGTMDHRVRLGRTDLAVSPAGLGCGGYSRLGLRGGNSEKDAENLVRHAISLGVNFFDTARAYGTEEIVGRAIAANRGDMVVSTKTMYIDGDGNFMPAERLIASLEKSLERLGSDYVDIFSFHGVTPDRLAHCLDAYVPALQKQVDAGKIRHLGITESFMHDPTHEMLSAAVPAGCFDVVMVGFNFLNSGARDRVLPLCMEHEVGTQVMHAVRNALSNPVVLLETVVTLLQKGELDPARVDRQAPLGFIDEHPGVGSIVEAAYRYCRHEPGVSVVLTGTGSKAHLEANVAAIMSPALPGEIVNQLNTLFGEVRSVSGD